MTQNAGFVKPQDTFLSKRETQGPGSGTDPTDPSDPTGESGTVPDLAALSFATDTLRTKTNILRTDVLSYLWHRCRNPDTVRVAADSFSPDLFAGRLRRLADAMAECFSRAASQGTAASKTAIRDALARLGGGIDIDGLLDRSEDLEITCPQELEMTIADLGDHARRLGKVETLIREVNNGVYGGYFSPDLPALLSASDRLGRDDGGLLTEEVCGHYMRELALDERDPGRNRIPTRYTELDRLLGGGLYRGGVNVVLARPGAGKTQFLTNLLANKLREGFGGGITVFSLEMPVKAILRRTLLASSGHGEDFGSYLQPPQLETSDDPDSLPPGAAETDRRAREAWGRLWANPLTILDNSLETWGIEGIVRWLELRAARGSLPELVMIDYFQVITPAPGLERQPRHEKLEDVCARLSAFCSRHPRCCVLLLAQARRAESRAKGKALHLPELDDVAQCDALARYAWSVLTLARFAPPGEEGGDGDDAQGRAGRRAGMAERAARSGPNPADFAALCVAKNREGMCGCLTLKILCDCNRMLVCGEATADEPASPYVSGYTDDDFYWGDE